MRATVFSHAGISGQFDDKYVFPDLRPHSAQKLKFRLEEARPILLGRASAATGAMEELMANGTLGTATFLAAVFVTVLGQTARADDGCEVLRELVKASLHTATDSRAEHRTTFARWPERSGAVGSTMSGRQLCASTAQVTSRAFGQALAALNISVTWNRTPMDPGDYCQSHDLRQCHPSAYPLAPSPSPNQLEFVEYAWEGVRNAVASQMPYGTASGLAEFTSESLASAFSSNLDRTAEGPLNSRHPPLDAMR
ncbi:MAG: hypothetical protein ACREQ1_03220 [Woeseiaceae bacterium]